MNIIRISTYLIILFSSATHAAQESEYLKFFNKYQSLGDHFDTAVSQLYSDEAQIIAIRKMPDGIEQTMEVKGKKWKQMIIDLMEIGKQRGDKSEFSNIKIIVENNRAKITATRYATVKCFNDSRYYMIVEKENNGELKIVEEFMESPSQSKCANTSKNDLSLVLQGSVKMINKQLPIMVDSDTKLLKTSSDTSTLIFHYVLVNYLSTELDTAVLEQNLRPMLIQQTCTMPNMKPVLDQRGSISYSYNGKDQKQIITINVDKSSCM